MCRIRVRFSFLRGCQSRKSSPRCFDKLLGIQCTHVKCQCGRFMYIFEIVVFVCAFVLDCERHCFKCSKLNVSCFFLCGCKQQLTTNVFFCVHVRSDFVFEFYVHARNSTVILLKPVRCAVLWFTQCCRFVKLRSVISAVNHSSKLEHRTR